MSWLALGERQLPSPETPSSTLLDPRHSAFPHVRRDLLDHRVLAENDQRTARAIGVVKRGNIGCGREGAVVVRRDDHADTGDATRLH
jgi:hypothetical protein